MNFFRRGDFNYFRGEIRIAVGPTTNGRQQPFSNDPSVATTKKSIANLLLGSGKPFPDEHMDVLIKKN